MIDTLNKHWHHLTEPDTVELLDSDGVRGLDTFEVARRCEHYGPNAITIKRGRGPAFRFLLQFHQPLLYILIVASIIKAFMGSWVEAGVIFAVVLINAVVGFIQEERASAAIAALADTLVSDATVVRAGTRQVVPAMNIVPGDLIILSAGDKVPADIRLLGSRDMEIDESALTGESISAEKLAPGLLDPATVLAERSNMAFASTLITRGEGEGIVIATGDHTEVGRISELLSGVQTLDTPLTQKMRHFSHVILWVIMLLAGVTFVVGMLRGESGEAMFSAAVALAVGAIPEGLPATVTITLAIGVARMARRKAIVRKLTAVETLGSTTVICSDKTGTLTENQMTVQTVHAGGTNYDVTGAGYEPNGTIQPRVGAAEDEVALAVQRCLEVGALSNDSELAHRDGEWETIGDPTDLALVVSAMKGGIDVPSLRSRWERIDSVPFDSRNRYMATLNRESGSETALISAKGAVEAVLDRCVNAQDRAGNAVSIDRVAILQEVEAMASRGYRVLAMASKEVEYTRQVVDHDDIADLTFLGIQGMVDPPRPEAAAAIAICLTAGITVKMITGDHPLTAEAIATQLGLVDRHPQAVTGADLDKMTDAEVTAIAEEANVFARVSPEQKLRLVEALQARGNVVAMTGDGVNDAPALRRADVGVAMGERGTEVAKEASDIVLTDDNFASIEAAVEEGRGVFDNLTKFIIWTLPTNLGQALVIMVAVLAGVMLPVLPLQILWINLTTALLLGLMLAFEPREAGLMFRPPRDPDRPIITGPLLARIVLVGSILLVGATGLFWHELSIGSSDAEARTVAVAVFIVVQSFYLFNARSFTASMFRIGVFSNPAIWYGIAAMATVQIAFTYLPVMNQIFGSAPLSGEQWGRVFLVGIAAYGIVGFEKWLRGRSRKADVPTVESSH